MYQPVRSPGPSWCDIHGRPRYPQLGIRRYPRDLDPTAPHGRGMTQIRAHLRVLIQGRPVDSGRADDERASRRDNLRLLRKVSVTKSIVYSLRFRGLIIIGRHVKMDIARDAHIVIRRGRLVVGVLFDLPQATYMRIESKGRLVIDGNVSFTRGCFIDIRSGACLSVGSGSWFNEQCRVVCYDDIDIGSNCAISWGVTIIDSDDHTIISRNIKDAKSSRVSIGDSVWIGFNCSVLRGVTIGRGCVIGAGSVVNRDTPPGSLCVGNPARVVREDVQWDM